MFVELQKRLKNLKYQADYQRKFRKRKAPPPEECKDVGRPSLEDTTCVGLKEAILGIVAQESAADPKRRTEMIMTPRTLDELKIALEKLGYNLRYEIFGKILFFLYFNSVKKISVHFKNCTKSTAEEDQVSCISTDV